MSACISKHGKFSYYKEDPFIKSNYSLRMDGIYAPYGRETNHPAGHMFFYRDGTCHVPISVTTFDSTFWSHPEKALAYHKNWNTNLHVAKEWWGHYKVRNDSIYIQAFNLFYQSSVKRDLVELRGTIRNETIVITEARCSWCNSMPLSGYNEQGVKYFIPNLEYRFYPTSFKPDSSLAWFKKKGWYKKGLQEGRK